MINFSDRLKEALQTKQVSQSELARKIHLSQSIVNNYCTGRRTPPIDVLILICQALNESADYLLGLVD